MERDTSPEAQVYARERTRGMTLEERVAVIDGLWFAVRELAEAGIRAARPALSEAELRDLMVERLYGREYLERLKATRRRG